MLDSLVSVLALAGLQPAHGLADPQSHGPVPAVSYAIELLREPFPIVRIEMEFPADTGGETRVRMQPRWASARDLPSKVHGAPPLPGSVL